MDEILSVEQVADMFGVTKYTVREWLKEGKLKGFKGVGGGSSPWRIRSSEVERLAHQTYGDKK